MPSKITKKLGHDNAKFWRNSIYTSGPTDPVLYIFLGNHTPYANEASPNVIVDTTSSEKLVWDNMYAAKKVIASDVEFVVPRINWSGNTKFRQFDDTIDATALLSSNTSQNLKPMYIITTERNVYKCVSNNSSANSTVEPSGNYITSNGNISTADGYIWKYMYNIKPSNKFLTADWMPTPTSTNQLDYGVSSIGVVDGELTTILVTNGGAGYYNRIVTVSAFASGCSILTLANTINVAQNMAVTGTGIFTGAYITAVDTPNSKITLSTSSINAGGGTGNNITISTRVDVVGDGIGAEASATLNANGNVSKITVTTIGTDYRQANVFVYGSGTNANARPILSPKYGHAYNPAVELGASNLMLAVRIGEIDSTENGLISTSTSFRQYGLLVNPHKYGNTSVLSYSSANSVISQTTDVTVVAGSNYTLDEYVYQGTSTTTSSFYGYLNAQTSNKARLTKVKGSFTPGLPLIGGTSGVSRTAISIAYPEFQPYSGDILYIENVLKKDREDGQAENIKFVVTF